MTSQDLSTILRAMPKCELHMHIEGSLEPELALELAKRNHVDLPWKDLEQLKEQYAFTNLQSFLDLYYVLMGTLKTADDFRDLMLAYLNHAAEDGVRHAEIFFDPQVHVNNGLDYDMVLDGLEEGMRIGEERYGITSGLILCIVRDLPVDSARGMLELATPRANELLGIGLDSAEVGYPPELFTDVFDAAADLGLHRVAHAGEEGTADYIKQALDLLHVERIDHAQHALDGSWIMDDLAERHIPVTRCPLSNLRLKVVGNMHELCIHDFLDADIITTINSDDPAYFGGYVLDNYLALAETGLTLEEFAKLGYNSIEASFITDEERARLMAEFNDWKDRYLK